MEPDTSPSPGVRLRRSGSQMRSAQTRGTPFNGLSRRLGHTATFRVVSLIPLLLFLVIFAAYPIYELLRMATSSVALQQGEFRWSFAGMENFVRMTSDRTFRTALWNSGVFIVITTAVTLILGTVLALLVVRSRYLGRLARNVFVWPAVIAPVVVSVIWFLILSPEFGVLNKVFSSIGVAPQAWLTQSSAALPAVMLVDVWHWTPIVFLLVLAGLSGIDHDIYEAARIDGANEFQITQRITLPLLVPSLVVATVVRLIMGVKVFDEMFVLTHGGPGISTMVISLHIQNVFFGEVDLGYGAALGVTVVAMLLAIFLLVGLSRPLWRRMVQRGRPA